MLIRRDGAGFDCDGVLADLIPGMAKMCEAVSGRPCKAEDWVSYNYFEHLGMSHEQYLNGLIDHKVLESALPHENVATDIARISDSGMFVALITARDYHPSAEEVTREWFRVHGLPLDHLSIVGATQSKRETILSIPGLVGYIDDYGPHLVSLSEGGFEGKLFLRDQPWNQDVHEFTRLYSIGEYAQHVLESRTARNRIAP